MSLRVEKAGILDTFQDNGRWGYSRWGINPGGCMDTYALKVANWLVGNDHNTPVLEMHFPASVLMFEKDALVSICGADFSPLANGKEIPLWQPVFLQKGTRIHFSSHQWGARCYLSIRGGFALTPWLNSCSTNLIAHVGGWNGRKLHTNDTLPLNAVPFPKNIFSLKRGGMTRLPWKANYREMYDNRESIQFTVGPEWEQLEEGSRQALLSNAFQVDAASNRMGYTLQGPVLKRQTSVELLSSGVIFGTMQLLPGGQIIILMADHQTTGGYPRVGFIAASDLPRLAQHLPGEKVRFDLVSLEKAQQSQFRLQEELLKMRSLCFDNLKNYYATHGCQL